MVTLFEAWALRTKKSVLVATDRGWFMTGAASCNLRVCYTMLSSTRTPPGTIEGHKWQAQRIVGE
jgi:hypothetical protein